MHLARTKVAKSKVRPAMTDGAGTDTLDLRVLYSVLSNYQRGNFMVRMPDDRTGLAGKICDSLNITDFFGKRGVPTMTSKVPYLITIIIICVLHPIVFCAVILTLFPRNAGIV